VGLGALALKHVAKPALAAAADLNDDLARASTEPGCLELKGHLGFEG
jgi:hypothetical protein